MASAPLSAPSEERPAQLLEGPVLPPLARLAVPNTAANMLMITPLLVEAWRMAELGGTALAGVAMVFPLFFVVALAMASYGIFIAVALWLGPWRISR